MAAAAQEPKADTRAAFNVIPLFTEVLRNNGFEFMGITLVIVRLGHPVDERSLGRPGMENTHTFVSCGSPGPQKSDFEFDVQAEEFIAKREKLTPKQIEEILAAAFPKERVEIRPTVRLAPFAASPTNPGGVAESETSLLLDSGASFHAVGDVSLLTDPVPFPNDMRGVAVCADGTYLRIVGTGTLKKVGFSIPHVLYVDGLKKNLISVSQLDKDHGLCCCFHSKQCGVMLTDGTVVGGAILQDDGVYKLSFLEVPANQE